MRVVEERNISFHGVELQNLPLWRILFDGAHRHHSNPTIIESVFDLCLEAEFIHNCLYYWYDLSSGVLVQQITNFS